LFGSATITVQVRDDGGTNDGGVDVSGPQTFNITVRPSNDAPAFATGPNQTVLEESGPQLIVGWASAISAGPIDEAGQQLGFTVSADRPRNVRLAARCHG
jgi:hypothetical protein